MEAYLYEILIQGLGPAKTLHPEKRIYIPDIGVLSYKTNTTCICYFSTEQKEINLALEDMTTSSRVNNIKKISISDEVIKELMSKNRKAKKAQDNLEGITSTIILLAEKKSKSSL